jgi:hypothetical protein
LAAPLQALGDVDPRVFPPPAAARRPDGSPDLIPGSAFSAPRSMRPSDTSLGLMPRSAMVGLLSSSGIITRLPTDATSPRFFAASYSSASLILAVAASALLSGCTGTE